MRPKIHKLGVVLLLLGLFVLTGVGLRFNPHSFQPLLAIFLNLVIGAFVLAQDPRRRLNQVFALLNFVFVFENLLQFGLYTIPDVESAHLFAKVFGFGYFLLPPAGLHFCLEFTRSRSRAKRLGLCLSYIFALFLTVAVLFPPFEFRYVHAVYKFSALPNTTYLLSLAHLVAACSLAVVQVVYALYHAELLHRRKQLKYLIVAASIALVVGTSNVLLSFQVPVYPTVGFVFSVYALIMAYAIVRHRFLDIEVIVKKGAVYVGLTACVTGLYALLMVGASAFLKEPVSAGSMGVNAMIVIVVALAFEPLRAWIQGFVDRRFYRQRFNYRLALKDLSARLLRTLGRRELAEQLLGTVTDTVQVTRSWLVLTADDGAARLVARKGAGHPVNHVDPPAPLVLPPFLGRRLADASETVSREDLLIDVEEGEGEGARQAAGWLGEQGLELAVPLARKGGLYGVFFLGPKLSEEEYTTEDRELLQILANQAGVALENSALYDQTLSIKAYYDNIARSMNTGLLTVDTEDRVVRVNRAAEELLGVSRDTAPGTPALEAFGRSPVVHDLLESARSAGGEAVPARELALEDGRTLEVTASNLEDQGKPVGAVFLFADVTGRKELEQQLERTRRLAYLGEVASVLAHEIKNPLGSIRLFVESLNEKFADEAFRRRYARVIVEEIDSLDLMVRDLLQYVRPGTLIKARTNLGALLAGTLGLLEAEIREAGVSVVPQMPDEGLFVSADGEKLKRVFLNVVKNSLEAMSGCDTRRLEVSLARRNGQVEVVFADTGPGMEPAELERIFEPFFTTKRSGTGLGLALAHKIVSDHGGTIAMASHKGQGARTTITLVPET